jgi:hypothetical protein
LGDFTFLFIADSSAHFVKAEECFDLQVRRRIGKDAARDVALYFERRKSWERKQYGQFSNEDLESLQNSKERYGTEDFERLYASWMSGEIDDRALQRLVTWKYCSLKIDFATYLVRSKAQNDAQARMGNGIALYPATPGGASPGGK